MKIIVASTIVPFINGGGTFIVDWLIEKLKEYGHEADELKIPFSSNFNMFLKQGIGLRMYHLEDFCDRLICIRMPSYYIPHPDKYLWFIHHYREIYDLWGTELDTLPKDEKALANRECIKRMDDIALPEAKKIYTNSQIISRRLKKYNNIESAPVYPPLLHPEQFFCETYGNMILYTSRICVPKRQHLAIEAMRYTKTPVKLYLCGKSENEGYTKRLRTMIREYNLEKRVTFEDRWYSEEEKAKLTANSLACLYIPFDEDSYGYPSLEAHQSNKAVISCVDSGGTDELILDGENGWLEESSPIKLAKRFDELYENKKLAEKMGNRGKTRLDELNINWDYVIERFTE